MTTVTVTAAEIVAELQTDTTAQPWVIVAALRIENRKLHAMLEAGDAADPPTSTTAA